MRALYFVLVFVVAALLAGCGTIGRWAGDPSKTSLPPNLSVEKGSEAVALCYNGNSTTRQVLDAAALELCPEPGSSVRFLREDLNLNECPLVKKRRAVFVCTPPPYTPR